MFLCHLQAMKEAVLCVCLCALALFSVAPSLQAVKEAVAAIGEKISVRRFVKFQLGEGIEKKVSETSRVGRMGPGDRSQVIGGRKNCGKWTRLLVGGMDLMVHGGMA